MLKGFSPVFILTLLLKSKKSKLEKVSFVYVFEFSSSIIQFHRGFRTNNLLIGIWLYKICTILQNLLSSLNF